MGKAISSNDNHPKTIGPNTEIGDKSDDVWDGNLDDFLPSPPKPPSFFAKSPSFLNLVSAAIIVGIWFVASVYQWTSPYWSGTVSQRSLIHEGQYWRLLTALFVHKDLAHLLSNTPLFLIFGFYLQGFFGFWVFPFGAIILGVLTNLFTVMSYAPDVSLLGASGMLYAMVAMWLVFYMKLETHLSFGLKFLRSVGVSLVLLFPTSFQPQTSYTAHAYGFVLGVFFAWIISPIFRRSENALDHLV